MENLKARGTGTSDDIPNMLSDGEFVMTASANNGSRWIYKISKSTVVSLTPSGKPDRKKRCKKYDEFNENF